MQKGTTSVHPSASNILADEPCLTGYLLALRAAGRAEKTVNTYASALGVLRRFCDDRGMPALAALSTEHLREFFNQLYKQATARRAEAKATMKPSYRLNFVAAVLLHLPPHQLPLGTQYVLGGLVTLTGRQVGGAHDIREQDGDGAFW